MSNFIEDPLFYQMLGQQIGNNAQAEADAIRARGALDRASANTNQAILVSTILRQQLDNCDADSYAENCIAAGVRGVVRELLVELRNADPDNPLLDKDVRGKIFDGARAVQKERGKGLNWVGRADQFYANNAKTYGIDASEMHRIGPVIPFPDFVPPVVDRSIVIIGRNQTPAAKLKAWEEARDAYVRSAPWRPDETRSGPAKDKIKPNVDLRKFANVPAHTPDRDSLIRLVEALAKELHEVKPEAAILDNERVKSIFEEFMLHEAVKST